MYRKNIVLITAGTCLLLLIIAYRISSAGLFASNDADDGGSSGTGPRDDDDTSVHEDPADYAWNSSDVVSITLSGGSIDVSKSGVAVVSGSCVTITSAGTYRIAGTLNNGQVV